MRRHDHAHIGQPPAADIGQRAPAGRPAGFNSCACSLAWLDMHASRAKTRRRRCTAAPMPRRQLRLRSRKRVEAISGSDTTFKRANKDRPSLLLLLSSPLSCSLVLVLALYIYPSRFVCVTSAYHVYNRTVSNAAQNIYVYIRAHAYIDTWWYSLTTTITVITTARAILFFLAIFKGKTHPHSLTSGCSVASTISSSKIRSSPPNTDISRRSAALKIPPS